MKSVDWKSFTLKDYWHLLWHRKWLIIIPFFLTTSAATFVAQITTPVYQTTTTLVAEEIEQGDLLKGISRLPIPSQERLTSVTHRLKSRQFLLEIANVVRLRDYLKQKEDGRIANTGSVSALRKKGRKLAERLHLVKPRLTEWSDEDIIGYLQPMISIRQRSGLLEVSVTHSDPQLATQIANQLADTYLNNVRRRRVDVMSKTNVFITTQLQKFKDQLEQSEELLQIAKKDGLFESLTDENVQLVDQLIQAETELIEVEMDIRQKEQEKSQLQIELQTRSGATSPEVIALQNQVNSQQAKLDGLRKTYRDSYTPVKTAQAELETTRLELKQAEQQAYRELEARISPQIQQLTDEIKQLNIDKLAVNRRRGKYDAALARFPDEQSNLTHLLGEKEQRQQMYSFLLQRLYEANIMSDTETAQMGPVADVLDPATVPERPIKPNKKMLMAMGMVMGAGIGGGLLLMLLYFDHSIRSVVEAEQCFENIPILGVIPKLNSAK